MTTAAQLQAAVMIQRRLPGRADLVHLIGLIEAGCRSELELWCYAHVFNVGELRGAVRQRTIVVRAKTYYLDMAYEAQQLAVELDGRQYHASPAQWAADIARDLALATLGWQTIRLSDRRLTTDIAGCRRDVLAGLRRRSYLTERERQAG